MLDALTTHVHEPISGIQRFKQTDDTVAMCKFTEQVCGLFLGGEGGEQGRGGGVCMKV